MLLSIASGGEAARRRWPRGAERGRGEGRGTPLEDIPAWASKTRGPMGGTQHIEELVAKRRQKTGSRGGRAPP